MFYSVPHNHSWSMMMMMMGSRVSSGSDVIITHMHNGNHRYCLLKNKSSFFFLNFIIPFFGSFVCNSVVLFIVVITLGAFVM
jgi:hypothetical protein